MYQIIVKNAQGASDGATRETKQKINAYLKTWADPQNLTADVSDENGNIVGDKPMGKKRISWAK